MQPSLCSLIVQLQSHKKWRGFPPFIGKYLFKEVSAIKMRACLLGRSTTRAIHSFDDFIWTRELSALAIMRYCLPFDSVATARAALR